MFYDDGMSGFSSTFFNQTVELYTPEEGVGFGDSLRLIFFLASTVFVGGLFYFLVFKEELPTLKKTTRSSQVRQRTVVDANPCCFRCLQRASDLHNALHAVQDDSWVQPRK